MKFRRAYRSFGWWLIARLIRHFHWHNTILDTNVPNVGCLKVKSLIVVNSYGQEHKIA